ncbi:OmpA family protein [Photobacterium sp. WH77]|uniref:OmpA family protein n=1 Tax=Photobacterium arenosum TaxID=2774143 RepID=A0ABR9BHF1_9GAMM|nr:MULTISPECIES: OmpA family protein [Photobacterium]MBD8511087.1 OmpA family protein [Photobacterium arenosum]MCG2837286.1 OmpA family protein [Photobacterium sp. WH77]MCG2844902.1 OmpA family protein [Photobacterium sp. WH80]MDO6583411.1 OmpA family protein [Photobacterium sp. 2_MG-2023]
MRHSQIGLITLSLLILSACADMPDTATTRHQIDDLRDADQDGVINQRDICLDTLRGAQVDEHGCASWQVFEKLDVLSVYFNFDDDHIRLDQSDSFDELLTIMNDNHEAKVILVGDTSPEGTDEYNDALAQRRTGVIKDALVLNGIAPERISEQRYTQITSLTQFLKVRKRRTIAVVTKQEMAVKPAWTIFSSEQTQ